MGPPPRSLTAEANSCFMVRVLHGPNRIQGCGASIAPERGLPSDQLYRTSNNEGHRVAVTLDTKVLRQGCVKTCTREERTELCSLSSFGGAGQSSSFLIQRIRDKRSTRKFDLGVFTEPGPTRDIGAFRGWARRLLCPDGQSVSISIFVRFSRSSKPIAKARCSVLT
jgi:hypothetical protein